MRIYIVDCDRALRSDLNEMIEKLSPGSVIGSSSNWEEGWLEMQKVRPDIILADLFFPAHKTLDCIRRIRIELPGTSVIVMLQGNNIGLVRQAYEAGAELLIHKPIHVTEVENALRLVELAKTMEWLVGRVTNGTSDFREAMDGRCLVWGGSRESAIDRSIRRLKEILHELGIFSESGSKDVIRIITYLMEEKLEFGDVTICELCGRLNQNAKSVEQRIRRAAADGLANLAYRGMEDYADPVFNEYAGRLYSFDQIKKEMDYIRGKSEKHGNVRIRNFLNGLLECCKDG